MDDEAKGQGLQYDYGFRIYDPRLGKFLSIDPLFKGFPQYSPYQFAGNSPILNVDLDGLEEMPVSKSRLVIRNVVIVNGKEVPEGTTVKVLLNHDFNTDKILKVRVGTQVLKEGYDGSQASYYTNIYRSQPRPSLGGVRQYSVERRIDSLVDATSPPPAPKIEIKPLLNTPNEDEIKRVKITTKIKNEPQETINENTINQNQKTEPKKENISFSVEWKKNVAEFKDEWDFRRSIDPIIQKLKSDPSNYLILSPNTNLKKGSEIEDNFWWFQHDKTIDEVIKERAQVIEDYMRENNVSKSQYQIQVNDNNYEKSSTVTGTLTTNN